MTKRANTKFLRSHEIDTSDNIVHLKNKKRKSNTGVSNLQLREIHPLTKNQGKVFDVYNNTDNHIILSGYPGVGKSFLALYLAFNDILYGNKNYERIIIIKSLVKSRECGHLPGDISDKQDPFFSCYYDICGDLFGRGDAAEILLKKEILSFENTSFLRGLTFNNCIVFVDEFQNSNFQELDTISCRLGTNSRFIFSGDLKQTDLLYSRNDVSGYVPFMKILENMDEVDVVHFEADDIVRSSFVKNYIIQKVNIGLI